MLLENTVTGHLTFLLEVLLRCFSILVKLRSFLSYVLLEHCLGEWSLLGAWKLLEPSGKPSSVLPPKTDYTDSVRGLQPCFLSSKFPSF